jgi:hypothetical protein
MSASLETTPDPCRLTNRISRSCATPLLDVQARILGRVECIEHQSFDSLLRLDPVAIQRRHRSRHGTETADEFMPQGA